MNAGGADSLKGGDKSKSEGEPGEDSAVSAAFLKLYQNDKVIHSI